MNRSYIKPTAQDEVQPKIILYNIHKHNNIDIVIKIHQYINKNSIIRITNISIQMQI